MSKGWVAGRKFHMLHFKIKKILLLCSLISIDSFAATANIILMRHSEKGAGSNPHLSAQGNHRAQSFINLSKIYEIAGIFSSNYNRTIETAIPLANHLELAIDTNFSPVDYKGMLANIVKKYDGKSVVVIGHSNTIPGFINYVLGDVVIEQIDESDFSKLFILQYNSEGLGQIHRYKHVLSDDGSMMLLPYD